MAATGVDGKRLRKTLPTILLFFSATKPNALGSFTLRLKTPAEKAGTGRSEGCRCRAAGAEFAPKAAVAVGSMSCSRMGRMLMRSEWGFETVVAESDRTSI